MTAVADTYLHEHDDRQDRRTAARERRLAQAAQGLAELLEKRPELGGACPWAAFAVDAVRWST